MARPTLKKLLPHEAEDLKARHPGRPACQDCGLWKSCESPWMFPFAPRGWKGSKRILMIGEAPGEDEDLNSGKQFTGKAGQLLRNMWREAGIEDGDVALINSLRCRPPGNRTPSMREVRVCRPFLLAGIRQLLPRYVLCLGGVGLKAFTNDGKGKITQQRGRPVPLPDLLAGWYKDHNVPLPRTWATYHPAAITYGQPHLRAVIVGDLKKMLEERTEPTMPPDQWPGVASMSVTVDTEFDGAELLGLAVAGPGYAAWTDQPWQHEVGQAIVAATNLVGHNVAVDLDHLVRRGYAHESWADGTHVRDTLLLHRMANENRTSYKLEDLAVDLLDLPPWKDETQELIQQGKIREIPREVLGARCRRDVWATDLLSRTPEVKKLDPGLIRFTTRVALACHRISLASAVVDMDRFEEMGLELRTEAEKHRELLFRVAKQHGMEAFSPTNDDNLRELLFDVLGLPSVRTTDKTGKPAVDKTSLTQVEELDETGAVGYLLQFNKWDKLLSTWYGKEGGKSVPLSRLIEPVGYVEGVPIGKLCFRLNPLGAKTGRRSSSRPNAQNWPESVRGIIRSRWPKGLILNADYKSLEVLLISWLSGEEKLFEYFNTGSGYLGVVKELFNMEVERGSEMYRLAKSLVLGMDYNMGKNKLADDLWYRANVRLAKRFVKHREEAGKLRDLYFSKFPKLKQYTQDRRDEILSSGQVTSLTGRVRRLPCPEGKFTDGFKRLWNQAVNFPVQSLASDVTGAAMVELEQGLAREHGLTVLGYYRMLLDQPAPHMRQRMSVLFNEVHDSLVVDVDPDRRDRDVELVVETMREAKLLRQLCPEFTLPLQVETTLAPEWGK